jgi:hypothetical protein
LRMTSKQAARKKIEEPEAAGWADVAESSTH